MSPARKTAAARKTVTAPKASSSPDASASGRMRIVDRDISVAAGEAARRRVGLDALGEFDDGPSRDPVGLIIGQDASRVPELVPVRHGRMLASPFAFYRGAALPMAADLSVGASPGLWAQLCGDAHLSNFGAFGSPERRLVFDVNDFDETLPGPFEWDVKRLLASLAVAGRSNGLGRKKRRKILLATGAAYRESMRSFAGMPMLDVWYARADVEQALADFESKMRKKSVTSVRAQIAKARTRDNTKALSKLTRIVGSELEIVNDPPLIVPIEELAGDLDVSALYAALEEVMTGYALTLPVDRRRLIANYRLSRIARKVVGVGSVGTEAWILLMRAADGQQPLLLQAKQASNSVLASYLEPSEYENQGQRVVAGQQLMQAVSDVFLGWQQVGRSGQARHDYYVRQLRDWKYSVDIETLTSSGLRSYGQVCGWTLARAHARSGDRIAIASYLGDESTFEEVLADFAEAYADQNERDYDAMVEAATSGRIEATTVE